MDYFPVTVTQLPIIDGVRQTPEQFLEYIRKNINSFVDTNYAEFEPYQWCGMDEPALWNSSNPIGAVIGIDIGVQIMVTARIHFIQEVKQGNDKKGYCKFGGQPYSVSSSNINWALGQNA